MVYEKEKEEAERMLKVIEEPPRWLDNFQGLVPLIYTLAISTTIQSIVLKEFIKNHG